MKKWCKPILTELPTEYTKCGGAGWTNDGRRHGGWNGGWPHMPHRCPELETPISGSPDPKSCNNK